MLVEIDEVIGPATMIIDSDIQAEAPYADHDARQIRQREGDPAWRFELAHRALAVEQQPIENHADRNDVVQHQGSPVERSAFENAAMVEQKMRNQPCDGDGEHKRMLELRLPGLRPRGVLTQRRHSGGPQVCDYGDVAEIGEIAEEHAPEISVAKADLV